MLKSKTDTIWESGFILCFNSHGRLPGILWAIEMSSISSQGNFFWKNNSKEDKECMCMKFIASFYIKLKKYR